MNIGIYTTFEKWKELKESSDPSWYLIRFPDAKKGEKLWVAVGEMWRGHFKIDRIENSSKGATIFWKPESWNPMLIRESRKKFQGFTCNVPGQERWGDQVRVNVSRYSAPRWTETTDWINYKVEDVKDVLGEIVDLHPNDSGTYYCNILINGGYKNNKESGTTIRMSTSNKLSAVKDQILSVISGLISEEGEH